MKIISKHFDEKAIELAAINSLLLDSGSIAELQFDDGSYCELRVCGDKKITSDTDIFTYAEDYTEDLRNYIINNFDNNSEHEDYAIWENNWIDFMYYDKDGNLLSDGFDVVDGLFGNTKEEVEKFMLECKRLFDDE